MILLKIKVLFLLLLLCQKRASVSVAQQAIGTYTSHRECPINKKKQQEIEHVGITSEATSGDSIATSEEVSNEVSCICESDRASHQQNCSLNPRNITRP